MTKLFFACYKDLPDLRWRYLPEPDQPHARMLNDGLRELASVLERFGFALTLFERCEKETAEAGNIKAQARSVDVTGFKFMEAVARFEPLVRYSHGWQLIAAKEGAMCVYDFGKAITGIRRNREISKALCELIKHEDLEDAHREFRERFPEREQVRNAAAHPAELAQTVADRESNAYSGQIDQHGISGNFKGAMISFYIHGRTVFFTIDNKLVEYEFSFETFEKLRETQQRIYSIFAKAAQSLREMARAKATS